jgi:hypothetical protein
MAARSMSAFLQRSSESIARLAAALAKAHAELTNPEKSLLATIRPNGPWRGRTVVPLCTTVERLDIVRKDLRPE